jgi:hypothetical protein
MPRFFIIESVLGNLVLDIQGGSTAPRTPIIAYPRNGSSGSSNQLWTITDDGFIQSKLNGYVLDIQGGSTAPRTPIIAYPKNGSSGTPNQMWRLSW